LLTKQSEWDRIASPYSFNIIRWEFENLFDKWEYKLREVFDKSELSEAESVQLVRDYLSLAQEITSLEARINREKAEGLASEKEIADWEAELAALKTERDRQEGQVEEIIEGQISGVLADEGLSTTLKLGGEVELLFPPVDFEFEERPNLLIVSTRHKIEFVDTVLLRPGMSLEEMVEIEGAVEALDYSGLVAPLGGVATYPSIVSRMPSLQNLLSKIAHEWLHHYFFFRPLGQRYWSNYEMTTINETAADIAGNEIGLMVYERYYGGEEEAAPPAEEQEPAFDFGREMREIRLTVDQYLARGEIEEAERYMEEKRKFLEANGCYIRKLNQAYFAFHGTYADTPTSVSPIGGQLRKLRERSSALGDFIGTVSGISSYEELLKMVGE
jgi:predicted  nucleic acid-binding Zn-ribbon protein